MYAHTTELGWRFGCTEQSYRLVSLDAVPAGQSPRDVEQGRLVTSQLDGGACVGGG
jgi:hypothetical protein